MLRLMGDRVAFELLPDDKRTPGGLVMPDRVQAGFRRGRVYLVGPGRMEAGGKRLPMTVKAGDVILLAGYDLDSIRPVIVDGRELLICTEDAVFGVVDESGS